MHTAPQSLKPPPSAALERTLLGAGMALLIAAFFSGLRDLVRLWNTQEEYSFGYMVPVVAAYMLWQRRHLLGAMRFSGSWTGTAMVAAALVLLAVGELGTLGTVVQYAFLLALYGLILSYCGWPAVRAMAVPLAVLAFMVPLPNYFLRESSAVLQLWSSQLGVAVIRAFGISVFLEGNVIDLGALKLQVVEACSGLRYLIPLMTLGFIAACLFRAPLWKRALLFVSTVPITLLMNSARIGLIGVLSDRFGKSQAEGFLHDFEGWAVFMVCMAILFAEIVVLAKIGHAGARFSDVFGLEPELDRATARSGVRGVQAEARIEARASRPFLFALALAALAACVAWLAPAPAHQAPPRAPFSDFPLAFDGWRGTPDRLEPEYLQMLQLDDYVLADYAQGARPPVNLYVAYYNAQTNGNSAHSPRACIPGDGWEITDFSQRELPAVRFKGLALRVNRAVISKGENRQLVYYWFQQRGRVATDEYVVKLQIFRDAVVRNRSDGAMVRLVARLQPGESDAAGDAQLESFAAALMPRLGAYIPD